MTEQEEPQAEEFRPQGIERVTTDAQNTGGAHEARVAQPKMADTTAGSNASSPAHSFEQRVTTNGTQH